MSMDSPQYVTAMERLIALVQQMSLIKDLPTLMALVRSAARELVHADGATFVLRNGDLCHYADEDAIHPLWKGQSFPMDMCISGWAMQHRQSVIIEDIYADDRIPHDAYRPTFVKSLVMVPIRTIEPVGAIGTYWGHEHRASTEEVSLLRALADSTSIAMENVRLYQTLERQVEARTAELEASRTELAHKNDALVHAQRQKEDLAALIVHDLKSPANGIIMSSRAQLRNPTLSHADRQRWTRVLAAANVINHLALNVLDVARLENGAFAPKPESVDLQTLLQEAVELMTPLADSADQKIAVIVDAQRDCIDVDGEMFRRILQNVLDNAVRHSPQHTTVTLRVHDIADAVEIRVGDQGAGIRPELRSLIFDKYTCLPDDASNASGRRGLGLAFCRLAVEGHGGTIHVEDNVPKGSVFVIRLPQRTPQPQITPTVSRRAENLRTQA